MLSRSAQGLYWMGRYMERAQHLSRLLRLQTEALVDRPIREIYFGWRRIYASIGRQPPGGSLELHDDDDFTLADSYTLADDLTFERSNPGSVWSCFALGRENARQMRHCISGEMWTWLNLAYLRIQKLGIQDIWATSPESFYAETAAENQYACRRGRGDYVPRRWLAVHAAWIRHGTRPTLGRVTVVPPGRRGGDRDDSDDDWTSMLHFYNALEAYSQRFSVEVRADQVLEVLVGDPLLPHSLCRSLDSAEAELAGLGPGPVRRPATRPGAWPAG